MIAKATRCPHCKKVHKEHFRCAPRRRPQGRIRLARNSLVLRKTAASGRRAKPSRLAEHRRSFRVGERVRLTAEYFHNGGAQTRPWAIGATGTVTQDSERHDAHSPGLVHIDFGGVGRQIRIPAFYVRRVR